MNQASLDGKKNAGCRVRRIISKEYINTPIRVATRMQAPSFGGLSSKAANNIFARDTP